MTKDVSGHALVAALIECDLTPDEVRVITGLVRAMRTTTGVCRAGDTTVSADERMWAAVHAIKRLGDPGTAAWHIAHAISQMGES